MAVVVVELVVEVVVVVTAVVALEVAVALVALAIFPDIEIPLRGFPLRNT